MPPIHEPKLPGTLYLEDGFFQMVMTDEEMGQVGTPRYGGYKKMKSFSYFLYKVQIELKNDRINISNDTIGRNVIFNQESGELSVSKILLQRLSCGKRTTKALKSVLDNGNQFSDPYFSEILKDLYGLGGEGNTEN